MSIKNNIKTNSFHIADLQKLPIDQLIGILETYKATSDQPILLLERILNPLLERCKTIQSLGLGYLNLSRAMETLS